ncbi:MAG: PD-(D/E)XK nuclease family protein, partial [Candidatus Omnitrophota bacterium]
TGMLTNRDVYTEAPVVILADPLGAIVGRDPEIHVKRMADSSVGYFTVMKEGEHRNELAAMPENWAQYAADEALYKNAEAAWLDYVAATRAMNILVVSTYREGDRVKGWETFYGYLSGMEKIAVTKDAVPQKRALLKLTRKQWTKETDGMKVRAQKAGEESYHVASVTSLVKAPGIFTDGLGEGMAWGSLVHRALEACGKGRSQQLDGLVKNWLRDENMSMGLAEPLIRLADGMLKSPLWQRMQQAEEKYFELPFSTKQEDTVITGVMDLIFKEPDGWVIVDYKTDDFEKDPVRKAAYTKQLEVYADFWKKMTGERVKEMLLEYVS